MLIIAPFFGILAFHLDSLDLHPPLEPRRLQYSSPYWGAAVVGQMDLALAFGACNVICQAQGPEDIAHTCTSALAVAERGAALWHSSRV